MLHPRNNMGAQISCHVYDATCPYHYRYIIDTGSDFWLCRYDCSLLPDVLDRTIRAAFVSIGYESLTDNQRLAITEFVKGKDVFVCLPTREGKSLCFATRPVV